MLKQYFIKLWVRRKPTWQGVLAGVLAGAIGGLTGAGAKIVGELIDNPRNLGQVSPPLLFAEHVTGHTYPDLTEQGNIITSIHFTFSAAVGAVYGAAAEVFPVVTVGYGVGFGLVLQLFTLWGSTCRPGSSLSMSNQARSLPTHSSGWRQRLCGGECVNSCPLH